MNEKFDLVAFTLGLLATTILLLTISAITGDYKATGPDAGFITFSAVCVGFVGFCCFIALRVEKRRVK
jgi:hypothetical protein